MENEEKQWITDKIGEEYKEWSNNQGNKVFISAPTGSGKTHFILNTLLPYFYEQNKKILFLVNRRILKQQIEKEITYINCNYRKNIKVDLYQNLENSFCFTYYFNNIPRQIVRNNYITNSYHLSIYTPLGDNAQYIQSLNNYDCVVCDECHYFLADSNYNTNTIISYYIINKFFKNKLRIFLSATITDFIKYITSDENNISDYKPNITIKNFIEYITNSENNASSCASNYKTPIYNLPVANQTHWDFLKQGKIIPYLININYGYLDIHILNDKNDIIKLVAKSSDKWLIFVDNIDYGYKLKNDLLEQLKDDENDEELNTKVSIISASYKDDEESSEQVKEIINNNRFKTKVLIATSVMDNGINIKDIELRNIIIIADTEVEFIQMLGRKRKDEKKLKLYIIKQTKKHFDNRRRQVQKLLKIANDYLSPFEEFFQRNLQQQEILLFNEVENTMIINSHKYLMNDIAREKTKYEDIKKIFLMYNGFFYLNRLSVRNLENLDTFYIKMIKRFDKEGENAFLREQLEWLGKTSEEIDDIINNSITSTLEKYHDYIDKQIKEVLNIKMDRIENANFKEKIKKEVLYILDYMKDEETSGERKKYRELFYKKNREISKPAMDFLRKYCNFPYEIEITNESQDNKESKNEINNKKKDKSITYYTFKLYNKIET